MARANLSIDESIYSNFISAQDIGSNIRCLKVTIRDESLVLSQLIERKSSVSDDFNGLKDSLSESEACLLVFCVQENDTAAESGALKWMLIAWVPDGSKVREKMLYSSSREDLKRSLGLGYFTSEYAANILSDLNWDSVLSYTSKSQNHVFLSASEKLINEERSQSHAESTSIKSTAMGVMPFEVSDEVAEKLTEFGTGGGMEWLELFLQNETIQLSSVKRSVDLNALDSCVNAEEARFILLRVRESNFFIFSCPESVPVRVKMTMSSSKATVVATANAHGIKFTKALEIRAPDDIVQMIRQELEPDTEVGVGSGAALLVHAKPLRPGKGKARMSKFVETEDDN